MQLYSPLRVYFSLQKHWYMSFLVKGAYSFECDCVRYNGVIMTAPLLLTGTRNWALVYILHELLRGLYHEIFEVGFKQPSCSH